MSNEMSDKHLQARQDRQVADPPPQYAIWVENNHSNFGQYPFTLDRYPTKKSAEIALNKLFSPETIQLLNDAGLHFTIDNI